MRRNLVIARVGRKSLHHHWLEGEGSRNWDLRLAPYQEVNAADDDYVIGDVIPGPKWSGIRQLLNEWDGWRAYDHVWLPDDDILTDAPTVNRLFDTARDLQLQLFAPALDERSHYAHFITMRNRRFFARAVGFVEIMVPGFSTSALERLLPTLELTPTGWGWGLDALWPKLLGYENVGIIDGTSVTHTRPVGQMRDEALSAAVLAESDAIMADYSCAQVHATFGGWGQDLSPLTHTPDELLAELVRGFDFLIAHDPRILGWLMRFQQPHFKWPDYPVAGTPAAMPRGHQGGRTRLTAPP